MLKRSLLAATFLAAALPLAAEPVTIHAPAGTLRGFLTIRSQTGAYLGFGESTQSVSGDRIISRLVLHFKDGSLDDDTTIYTQRGTLHMVSDHHIQRGPFFHDQVDATIEPDGNVTMKTIGKDGKEKVETSHFDLPDDLANGLIGQILLNTPKDTTTETVGMLAPAGKGRLIKLVMTRDGVGKFSPVAGSPRQSASIFRVHFDLGGIVGAIAPLVNKQPADLRVWILDGNPPMLVRIVGQFGTDTPIISLEVAGTSYTHDTAAKK